MNVISNNLDLITYCCKFTLNLIIAISMGITEIEFLIQCGFNNTAHNPHNIRYNNYAEKLLAL